MLNLIAVALRQLKMYITHNLYYIIVEPINNFEKCIKMFQPSLNKPFSLHKTKRNSAANAFTSATRQDKSLHILCEGEELG